MRRTTLSLLFAASLTSSLFSQATAAKLATCAVQTHAAASDADRAFAAGDFAKAESLSASASTIPAFTTLVRSQIELDKTADALASAQKAVAALPTSGDAEALLGEALLRNGQIAEAQAAFNKGYTTDHCSALAVYDIGRFSNLASRHAIAAKAFATAHTLAPADPAITAAYATSLPEDARGPALKTLLASSPMLPPVEIARLNVALAIADQHKSCTPLEPGNAAKLDLLGLMLYGTHARGFGIKVKVDNADLPILELDSSVSGIVLNPSDAKKAGVKPLFATSPAPGITYYAVADHIKIGPLEYKDCVVRVAPAAALANSNSLIGTDFFRDHLQHIDYVLKTYTLTPYPTPAAGLTDRVVGADQRDWTPIFVNGSDILIPTLLNKKGPYTFLLATGSHISILAPGVNKKILLAVRDANLNLHGSSAAIIKVIPKFGGSDDDHALVYGPTGVLLRPSQPIKVPSFQFTNNEFLDDQTLSFDLTPKSHDGGIEISGLLGFSTLREFFTDIDYRNGLVKIAYDYNHLYTIRDMARDK